MVGVHRPLLTRRLTGMGTTIFAEMSALALETGSLNLGQGFPDTDGPRAIAEVAARAEQLLEYQAKTERLIPVIVLTPVCRTMP